MEQPANNHHNEDVHVEDQIDLSSIVKRLQAHVSEMQKHHAEEIVRADAVSAKKDNDKPDSNKDYDEGKRDRPLRESHFT
ncbi:hypothetical protein JHK87_034142 [Glycine soja]|nr:hypothetical protein JHK87_034142 [Glycine soja]